MRKPRRRSRRKAQKPSRPERPPYGMRMKGGVRFDPEVNGFVAIVHIWDNIECRGEPQEWRYPEVFPTEEAAMHYYKTSIRPSLEQMMAETANARSGTTFIHRKLEE